MAMRWTYSTEKHGIDRDDVINAMRFPVLVIAEFDEARQPGSRRPDLYLGPQRRRGAPLLEVMVERVPPRDIVVFHAMIARPKFLALLDTEER